METAALTFRTKQYSTSYSSHICYGKWFYNDFCLNHHTIALVNNCLKLLSCVVIETALDLSKRINYLNSLLSTKKRTILTSSPTVLNAMIAMHVHSQLWLIILLLGIRGKVNTGELFSLLWKVWTRSIINKSTILTVSFQLENVPFSIQSYSVECNDAMHVHRQLWLIILFFGIREKVNTEELFSLL